MLLLLLSTLASAEPASFEAGLAAVGAVPSGGGGFYGAFAIPATDRWTAVAGYREVLVSTPTRFAGTVRLMARYTPESTWFLEAGLTHAHEIPWDIALDRPVQSLIGTGPGIRHRSGVGAGLGYELPLDLGPRWAVQGRLSLAAFPDIHPSPVYLNGEVGLRWKLAAGWPISRARRPTSRPTR